MGRKRNAMDFLKKLAEIHIGSLSLDRLFSAIVLLVICIVVMQIVQRILKRALVRLDVDSGLRYFVLTAARVVLWVLTVLIVADSLGIPVTSLVAVVSVVGLALSLALQNILSNLFSGVTVLVTRPFTTGDYVEFGNVAGRIAAVGLFYTRVNTLDNKVIRVPNSTVTASQITNFSEQEFRRVDQLFTASYKAPTELVRGTLLEVMQADPRILNEPAPPFAAVNAWRDSAVEYVTRAWVRCDDYWDVCFDLNAAFRAAFEKNGIEIPYPQMDVHMVGQ